MLHTIRTIIDNDELFRNILRGLNKTFYHQTVTEKQVEDFINKQSGKDFSKVFEQYLRNTSIPVLEYKITTDKILYRWTKCVQDFNMPVKIHMNGEQWIRPTDQWQSMNATVTGELEVDRNFYIETKKTE